MIFKYLVVKLWILRSSEAKAAAVEMNQTYIARGAQQAIVVKFADTPKEKEKRKLERQVSLEIQVFEKYSRFKLKNAAVQLRELCSDDDEDIIASVILPSIKHKLNIKAKPFKPNYDRIQQHQRKV